MFFYKKAQKGRSFLFRARFFRTFVVANVEKRKKAPMINRDLIRIKNVQLTYAYYQNGNRNMDAAEKVAFV